MITYDKMSKLSAVDMVALWNKGFEGYYIPIDMNLDRFLARAVSEGLSLEHSLVVYDQDEPIGFAMNGFRVVDGKKVAWNGGTGISSEHRGKGIGKLLIERNLQYYRELEVDIALLEALVQNERAIKLYRNAGYDIIERLISLQHTEALDVSPLRSANPRPYAIRKGQPSEVKELSFYKIFASWQTQWSSTKDLECLIVSDGNEAVGYAYYKRAYGQDGKLTSIALYQCESMPGRADAVDILKAAISEVVDPLELHCKRLAINLRKSNEELIGLLESIGFTSFAEQVHMKIQL
ncbi:GNAT family N-acetyltransferase [Cohnella lupini]|uniref:Ribosomal protein S18 acetylase RimI-like enzyme n=1 Tax=Cohnella lupini TaxID=1294267 RepID=A0A3D9HTS8_9BACL|nr:GNAT family N-acetyltransferase [Cohnella lupini]RED52820.1 ribosomal protein S18 acetylase RimI-like enzyme [Cohnella lupini]